MTSRWRIERNCTQDRLEQRTSACTPADISAGFKTEALAGRQSYIVPRANYIGCCGGMCTGHYLYLRRADVDGCREQKGGRPISGLS